MSVVGKSVADPTPVEVYQPVGLVSGAGGLGTEDNPIYTVGGSGGGPVESVVFGSNGTSSATQVNPFPVTIAQGVISSGPVTLVANVAQTIIGAFADRRGFRVLNYTAAPVYVALGTTGTPPSGGGSDFIPAASGGIPGQWEPPFAPTTGVRAVGAADGQLTVFAW